MQALNQTLLSLKAVFGDVRDNQYQQHQQQQQQQQEEDKFSTMLADAMATYLQREKQMYTNLEEHIHRLSRVSNKTQTALTCQSTWRTNLGLVLDILPEYSLLRRMIMNQAICFGNLHGDSSFSSIHAPYPIKPLFESSSQPCSHHTSAIYEFLMLTQPYMDNDHRLGMSLKAYKNINHYECLDNASESTRTFPHVCCRLHVIITNKLTNTKLCEYHIYHRSCDVQTTDATSQSDSSSDMDVELLEAIPPINKNIHKDHDDGRSDGNLNPEYIEISLNSWDRHLQEAKLDSHRQHLVNCTENRHVRVDLSQAEKTNQEILDMLVETLRAHERGRLPSSLGMGRLTRCDQTDLLKLLDYLGLYQVEGKNECGIRIIRP